MKNFVVPTIFKAIDKLTAPLRYMARNVTGFAQSVESAVSRGERMFRRFTPTLGEATRQMFSFAKSAAIAALIVGGISFTARAFTQYEDAVQSFRTIVSDLNDTDFSKYQNKISEVAFITKKSTIDVAKGFEMIAGLNAKFAETPESIAAVTTAAITLSKASREDLGKSASNLTGILNQFNLAANQSDRVINVLAAGQAVGASSISQTADAFTVFGSVAKEANLTLEQSVGLVEVLASKQIQGAEAGTALRGSILALQKAGLGYKSGIFNTRDALVEFNSKMDKLATARQKDAYAEKVFGVINRTTGTILKNNIALFDEYTKGVTGTTEAHKAAAINTNSFSTKLQELKDKWINIVTSNQDANGALKSATKIVGFLGDNLGTIVKWGTKILIFFAAWKAILITTRIALAAYNIALGITGALSGTASVAIGRSTIAMQAYAVTSRIATAAQWAWNAALTANPIGLIIVAVAALAVGLYAVYNNWNEWGAAISLTIPVLGTVLSMIQSFRRNWDMIKESFSKGGIIEGIKAIGKVLLDAFIMPVQQVFKLIAEFTGAKWAKNMVQGFDVLRNQLGVNTETDESGQPLARPALNPELSRIESRREFVSKLTITDKTGLAQLENDNPLISLAPRLSSTAMY